MPAASKPNHFSSNFFDPSGQTDWNKIHDLTLALGGTLAPRHSV
jgi:hypothetical protein